MARRKYTDILKKLGRTGLRDQLMREAQFFLPQLYRLKERVHSIVQGCVGVWVGVSTIYDYFSIPLCLNVNFHSLSLLF